MASGLSGTYTLNYSAADGTLFGSSVQDGTGGSADIPGHTLEIYAANASLQRVYSSTWGYYADLDGVSDDQDGIATEANAYYIIREMNGAKFSFQGINVVDYLGAQPNVRFEAVLNGQVTGSVTLSVNNASTYSRTFSFANGDLPEVFGSVDEIRISNPDFNEGGGYVNWLFIDDIVVGPSTAPAVTSISSHSADGTYKIGDVISITVAFDKAVNVSGTPTLQLETGSTDRKAVYSGGNGTNTLTFTYTVQAGDSSADLDYIQTDALELNGATIRLANSTVGADLTLPAPGAAGSLGANKAILIDGIAPTVTSILRAGGTEATNANTLTYTVTFSEAVTGVSTDDFSLTGAASGSNFAVSGFGTTYTITVSGVSGQGPLRLDLNPSGTGITDSVGNLISSGYTAGQSYTIDTIAPATTVSGITLSADTGLSGSDYVTKISAQTISAILSTSLGTDEFLWGSVDGGSTWTNITASVSGTIVNWSTILSSGNDALQFKIVDTAGNGGPLAMRTYTLDTVAPAATTSNVSFSTDTGSSSSDLITKEAMQTIHGTLSADLAVGDTVFVSLNNGATWTAATVDGPRAWSLEGLALTGSDTLKVMVTDIAGNNGLNFSHAYVLDTTAPSTTVGAIALSADSGRSASDFVTNASVQTVSGVLSTALSAGESLYGSTDGGASWTDITSMVSGTSVSWTSVNLSSGNGALQFKVMDTAGNVGTLIAQAYTLDTTPPTPVALSTTNVAVSAAGSGAPVATLSATDSSAATYALATGNGSNDADNGSFSIVGGTLSVGGSSLSAGTYRIYLSATDTAGNISYSTHTITVATAPVVTSIVRADGAAAGLTASAISAEYTVTFSESVTGVDASDFALTATGTASGSIASVSGSGTTYIVTVNQLAGDGTLRLDLNGGGTGIQSGEGILIASGYTSGATFVLDHTAPATPSTPDLNAGSDTGNSNSDNLTSNTTPTFSGMAEAGATVKLYSGTTEIGSAVATGGVWSITSSALAEGSHNITAKATDLAGNESAASGSLTITIDTTAPTLTITSDAGKLKAGGTATITFTFSEDPGNTFTWDGSVGDVVVTGGTLSAISGSGLIRTATFTPSPDTNAGTASITVSPGSYADAAGNVGGVGATLSLTFDTMPPGTPSLSLALDTGASAGDGITSNGTIVVTGLEAGSTGWEYSLDGGASWIDGAGTTFTLASGTYAAGQIMVRQTDVGGNIGTPSGSFGAITVDTTAPSVDIPSSTPGDDDTAVHPESGIVLRFDGDVVLGTGGAIVLYNVTDGSVIETISYDSTRVTGWGTDTITIDPAGLLPQGKHVSVRWDSTVFCDAAGNHVAENASDTLYDFEVTGSGGLVDGLEVTTRTVTNPDGSTSRVTTIPVVTSSRVDTSGNAGLADIPLVVSGGQTVLLAQVPVGYGLQASGPSAPQPAGSSLTDLIREIKAHTAAGSADQSQLTGNGAGFLQGLSASTPLLVQAIVPTLAPGSASLPGQPLVISGLPAAAGAPMTALVIDTSGLPQGAQIQLDNVDFAAVIGAATITGGAGSQHVWGDSASQTIFLGADDDELHGGGGDDWVGSQGGNDRLYGDDGNDTVSGGAGNDRLFGGNGHDRLLGGTGHDRLDGGAGNDTLKGEAGNDRITGGLGRDTLWGGAGRDVFDFNTVKDSKVGSQRDIVHDFKSDQDRIDLRDIDANALRKGNQKFSWTGSDGPFLSPKDGAAFLKAGFTGKAGELRHDRGILMGDTDGDGKADFQIKIVGKFAYSDVIL